MKLIFGCLHISSNGGDVQATEQNATASAKIISFIYGNGLFKGDKIYFCQSIST